MSINTCMGYILCLHNGRCKVLWLCREVPLVSLSDVLPELQPPLHETSVRTPRPLQAGEEDLKAEQQKRRVE